jgi:hypothetical protein
MFTLVTVFLCVVAVSADKPASLETPRKPHPLFPSLHELSDEEENRLDDIINRFIDYDSGKLKGPEGKKALADFQKLGPDAIPALLRGLNTAARIEHSCPAVQITRKLAKMLSSSRDTELLEFARENGGAGVERSRHLGIIKDLRVLCILRKRAVLNSGLAEANEEVQLKGGLSAPADPIKKNAQKMTLSELVEAAGKERGDKLKTVLLELGNRRGDRALGALGSAAASYDGDIQKLARELLSKQLSRLKKDALKEKFADDRAEVRAAAARVAGTKTLHFEKELIGLLSDEEKSVRQAAHDALVQLAGGADFGPRADAGPADRKEAAEKWRAWLDRLSGR